MHELSLVQSILDIIEKYKKEHKFYKVNYLKLSFGELSCVNKESLIFAFDMLSKDSVAEGAKLIFEIIPVEITCNHCKSSFKNIEDYSKCPNCNSKDIFLSGGFDELKLIELDVEA